MRHLLFVLQRNTRNLISRSTSSFKKHRVEEELHANKTLYLWKRISLLVALPVVSYLTWKNVILEEEHHEKRKYIPWPHMRIRNKPFPWNESDKSLFHNPMTNAGPDEDEVEYEDDTSRLSTYDKIQIWWRQNLFEDPIERERKRDAHLAMMQRRHENFLRKKSMPEGHIQPFDLVKEQKCVPRNPLDEIYNTS